MADKTSNAQQIAQAALDVSTQAFKVILQGTTEIALSSDEDSVLAVSPTASQTANLTNADTNGEVVVAAFDVSQVAQLNIITQTITTLVATDPLLTLELSPSATDDVWVATALTVVPSGTALAVVAGTPLTNNLYKRARVVLSFTDYTSGTVKLYVNGR